MMNHFPTRVLAIDGSEEAELALQTAVSLARSTGSEMHVVHGEHVDEGIPNPAEVLKRDVERTEQQAQHFLDRQVQRIRDEGVVVGEPHFRRGRPADEIVKLGEELRVGLVVMGSRGLGGIRRALMGSVSDSVIRHAPCPVMIVCEPVR
jgi:nucleotide-binding universal stress UspA family protein